METEAGRRWLFRRENGWNGCRWGRRGKESGAKDFHVGDGDILIFKIFPNLKKNTYNAQKIEIIFWWKNMLNKK